MEGERDKLFADAGLADDQNGCIKPRELLDHAEQFANLARLAQYAAR